MLSHILDDAKGRAQTLLEDHTQEEQKQQALLDQKWPHHTILLIVGKGNYNMESFKKNLSQNNRINLVS